ncbi:MAG: glycosyltransferase family 39 protein [Syntrophomonadaceae bacterium]
MMTFKERIVTLSAKTKIALSENVLIYLLMTLLLILVLAPRYLNSTPDMDEIWNYQFARRILYGQIPFRDFVMLPLPFSAQLNALFLRIFSDELYVIRWIGCSIAVINGITIFGIIRIIGKNNLIALIYTCVFLFPAFLYPHNNYSWLTVLFLSIALLLELMNLSKEKGRKTNWEFWIGLSLGFATITKQNIGVIALLASIIFLVLRITNWNHSDKGTYFPPNAGSNKYLLKSISYKVLGWSCVVGSETLYLWGHVDIGSIFSDIVVNMVQFAGHNSMSQGHMLQSDGTARLILALAVIAYMLLVFIKSLYGNKNELDKW